MISQRGEIRLSNWYCNFSAVGSPPEIERLKEGLDDVWDHVEIQESSRESVSVYTIQSGLFADGRGSVQDMVAQFALIFKGTI